VGLCDLWEVLGTPKKKDGKIQRMMGLFEKDGKKEKTTLISEGLEHHFPHFNGLKWG
jgi:hypothetical protein